jgi:hypothetical protein
MRYLSDTIWGFKRAVEDFGAPEPNWEEEDEKGKKKKKFLFFGGSSEKSVPSSSSSSSSSSPSSPSSSSSSCSLVNEELLELLWFGGIFDEKKIWDLSSQIAKRGGDVKHGKGKGIKKAKFNALWTNCTQSLWPRLKKR